MHDDDFAEWFAKQRQHMAREERIERWLLIGVAIATALALALLIGTLRL
jgi:hypothetical protein